MKKLLISLSVTFASSVVLAKLPAPSDEAKAKAAEVAAKTAWSGKVDNFLLCKSQDKVAASYYKTATATGKDTKPAVATPPCATLVCLLMRRLMQPSRLKLPSRLRQLVPIHHLPQLPAHPTPRCLML